MKQLVLALLPLAVLVGGQGVTVNPTSVTTHEDQTQAPATFTVVLTSQPTADVTIAVASSDTREGAVSASSLVFTNANWNTLQTVTVTGVQDAVDEAATISYNVVLGPITSTDAGYAAIDPPDVSASNTDDDVAAVTVDPTSLTTNEQGTTTATFTVRLETQPTADVTISLQSSDTTEGTLSVGSLVFTSGVVSSKNAWSTPSTVTVTAVDDSLADGDVTYSILTAAFSTDTFYSGIAVSDVTVVNVDDDTAGISTTPSSGLTTTEQGGNAAFAVALTAQPSGDVTLEVTSDDTTEGTVAPAQLVFGTSTWNSAQQVVVTGVADNVVDGSVAYTVTVKTIVTADAAFNGLTSQVSLSNTDSNSAGLALSVAAGTVLQTSEAGTTATFTVALTSEPTADVNCALTSSDATEATALVATCGTAPCSLTFTAANWNAPQTVTLTPVDDDLDDGDVSYTVTVGPLTSADATYAAVASSTVSATNVDNDVSGFLLNPTTGIQTTEAGGTATMSVQLTAEPTADVTVSITTTDAGEATVTQGGSMVFTAANWNTPQIATVTGQDDSVDDGDVSYSVIASVQATSDSNYAAVSPATASAVNTDDDTAAVNVAPTTGLVVSENGLTATFTVSLGSQPTADVSVSVTCSDTSEGVFGPPCSGGTCDLTFTPSTWGTAQTVTVQGVQDAIDDGDVVFQATVAAPQSTDAKYSAITTSTTVTVTCVDDDTSGVTVVPTTLTTAEAGTTSTFTVVLHTQPTDTVTIPVTSSDTTEGTVSTSSLVFTPSNASTPAGANQWATAQTVTVTGVDDSVADGDITYSVVLGVCVSTDSTYGGAIDPSDVTVTNTDDDTVGVQMSPSSGLLTSEAGGSAQVAVVLTSEPSADVQIVLTPNATAEVGVEYPGGATFLVFTPATWSRAQTVTVKGVDDSVVDGDQPFSVAVSSVTSTDAAYAGLTTLPSVVGVNADNDDVGVTVSSAAQPLVTTEAGGTATFTVVLSSQPTADVTVPISINDTTEGAVSTTSLVFTAATWSTPQVVTVTGADDGVADGTVVYTVTAGPPTSPDPLYNGLAVTGGTVSLLNMDNDASGIVVTAASGLTVDETGTSVTFTVRLGTAPLSAVTVPIVSGDATEASVSPVSLSFPASTAALTDQVVTVTGLADGIEDGPQTANIYVGPAVSADLAYNGTVGPVVTLTVTDIDSAGITVAPLTATTTESAGAGNTADITVAIRTEPQADVSVVVTSGDVSEGMVSTAGGAPAPSVSLVFTSGSWTVTQTVTVTGQQDSVDDGDVQYSLACSLATSADPIYAALACPAVAVTNVDDNTAGLTVGLLGPLASAGTLQTTEAGATAQFTVVLNTEPTADVTVAVASADSTEVSVSPVQLVFTASACSGAGCTSGRAQWSSPQTVTVTGLPDLAADGTVTTSVQLTTASADATYSALAATSVPVANTDVDSPGVTVQPHAPGLWTGRIAETGGAVNVSVALDAQPTADVTVQLATTDQTQAAVNPASLTFTPTSWNVSQIVCVCAVPDSVQDGTPSLSLVLSTTSADAAYQGLSTAAGTLATPLIVVEVVDDDTAGISVTPLTGSTSETGAATVFSVVLTSEPTAIVSMAVSSNDTTEGAVSPDLVVFDSTNWSTPANVTATGVDDSIEDGSVYWAAELTNALSADPLYNGMPSGPVVLVNADDDTAGLQVTPSTVHFRTGALNVTEAGSTQTFTIVLQSEPTANVTVPLNSADQTEAAVSPNSLTFTPSDWSVPRTVTVTGVDDADVDGDQVFFAAVGPCVSTDPKYHALAPPGVWVRTLDDDLASVLVYTIHPVTLQPFVGVVGYLDTAENGSHAEFWVQLSSRPRADVDVTVRSNDTSEGVVCGAGSPPGCRGVQQPLTLTFSPGTWATGQTVTVAGVQDSVDDGDVVFMVVLSVSSPGTATSGYENAHVAPSPQILARNSDDDVAGVVVDRLGSLTTTEQGGSATFSVVLSSQPLADVTLHVATNDSSEAMVSAASLVFTPHSSGSGTGCGSSRNSWACPQTLTVTGRQDAVTDGTVPYNVTLKVGSADSTYAALSDTVLLLRNADDDTPGVVLTSAGAFWSGRTDERGAQVLLSCHLMTAITADVTVIVEVNVSTEAAVAPAVLLFNSTTWGAARTITVTGVDDDVVDGDAPFAVTATVNASGDPGYPVGTASPEVPMVNGDNDTAGVLLVLTTAPTTTEAGGTALAELSLTSKPVQDVTVPLSVAVPADSGGVEAVTSPTSVTFTTVAADWRTPRTITITGQDDDVADGDVLYNVTAGPATSTDAVYQGLASGAVTLTCTDDDVVGFDVQANPVPLVVTEAGGTATFTIAMKSRPLASVTLPLAVSDHTEGTVDPAQLVFNVSTWKAARTVTVTGVDDDAADGDVAFAVLTEAARSSDPAYSGFQAADVAVVCSDDDQPGLSLCLLPNCTTPLAANVTEQGGTALLVLSLSSEPTANVVAPVTSSDTSEGTVNPGRVLFTPLNWTAPQTVTVTGVQDAVDDGDIPFTVRTEPLQSTDTAFNGLNPPDLACINLDDDLYGATVSPLSLTTAEAGAGRSATFTVSLHTQPAADVTIGLKGDPAEGLLSAAQLLFTSSVRGGDGGNQWTTPQTVTVTGVDDSVDDGDVTYNISVGPASSQDVRYNGLQLSSVSVVNVDNDVAGFALSPGAELLLSNGTAASSTFTLALSSQPLSAVTVPVSATGSGAAQPSALVFSPSDWSTPQSVTVGANGTTTPFTVSLGPANSTDPNYGGGAVAGATNVSVIRSTGSPCPWAGLVAPSGSTCTAGTGSAPSGTQCSARSNGAVCASSVCLSSGVWSTSRLVCYCGSHSGCTLRSTAATTECPTAGCDDATCCAGGAAATSGGDSGVPVWAVALAAAFAGLFLVAAGVLLWQRSKKGAAQQKQGQDETLDGPSPGGVKESPDVPPDRAADADAAGATDPQPAYSEPDARGSPTLPDDWCQPAGSDAGSGWAPPRGQLEVDPYEVAPLPVSLRQHDPAGDWLRTQSGESLLAPTVPGRRPIAAG